MVLLLVHAGIDMVHVPYRGAGSATVDLLTGRVHALFSGAPQIISHVRSGKLRAIGVGHSERLRALPDVPTIAETVTGFYNSGYYGLLGPPALPQPLVVRINEDLRRAFSDPEVVKRMESQGLIAAPGTPAEFRQLIAKDIALWRKIIKNSGISAETVQ
jgi:tripartite-type tricarboxylate transporter receptor subunit TctC